MNSWGKYLPEEGASAEETRAGIDSSVLAKGVLQTSCEPRVGSSTSVYLGWQEGTIMMKCF